MLSSPQFEKPQHRLSRAGWLAHRLGRMGAGHEHFSPNDTISEHDAAMKTATQDNSRSKKVTDPDVGDVEAWRNKEVFKCLPDKLREWSRAGPKDGSIKFAPSKGWGWRYTVWKSDILYTRNDAV
eukprot:4739106-Pyramimonas_sp.AAC.1